MNLVTRSAQVDDIPGIVHAYLASWSAAYDGLLAPDVLESQLGLRRDHDWREGILSDAAEVAIGVEDGEIVGVVQATESPGLGRDLPEITMLYVVPSSWGSPAARSLLVAAMAWMADRGHPAARLRVVEAQARARRFYEREGWRIDEHFPPAHNGFFPLIYYRRDLSPLVFTHVAAS